MKFIDEAEIEIGSGHGGPGCVSFMRQAYMPRMGPDGGDGGRGGDVIFVADPNMGSLLDFRYARRFMADDGQPGQGSQKNGRSAQDKVIKVPVGTQIWDRNSGQLLADLDKAEASVVVLKGGRGGLGNMNFATSWRQAPDFAQPGEEGQRRSVRLELKLLADVALVGFPNAGKSTLISHLSAAKPKIAAYPFTTLVPHLGVVKGRDRTFCVADIPGLLEGAHRGKGLGHHFLKHCERSRFLLFVLNPDPFESAELLNQFQILRNEVEMFSPALASLPFGVVVSKSDAFSEEIRNALSDLALEAREAAFLLEISAVSGFGLQELKDHLESSVKLGASGAALQKQPAHVAWGDASLFAS